MKSVLFISITAALALTACSSHTLRTEGTRTYLFLKIKNARSVMFASSLDRFQRRPAEKISRNTWRVTIPRDIPQSYFYFVDDKVFLPDCRLKETDDFGSQNCIYFPGM
jgi:hypothetical protein